MQSNSYGPDGCLGSASPEQLHGKKALVQQSGSGTPLSALLPRTLCWCGVQVKSLVLSPDPHERLAGVLAIDELAQTKVGLWDCGSRQGGTVGADKGCGVCV